jgi:hypothetical protein
MPGRADAASEARAVSTRRLESCAQPGPDAIPLEPPARWPFILGEGELDYVCHRCARTLCSGIAPGDLADLEIRCGCGAVGRVPSR